MINNFKGILIIILSFLFLLLFKYSNADDYFPYPFFNDQSNQVILFTEINFQGEKFIYNTSMGYLELPNKFHNNVGSFISGTINVCFIKWDPFEQHQIYSRRVNKDYFSNNRFGSRIDGIYNGLCRDSIWK
ncbi:hypothetical protein DDB_G0278001 [Dictyostelium discoideum AX4]|uniref:Uncharacterized gerABC family protein DDB_G0278001 n=1 Tax=Dictyostelium discoideum TaxID=44689 RepID=GERL1_DICDI|nr:hypothetical protein DDB_G0278001 [Dictyostelium discoideum AX4]Q54YY8.1 RecName: Full=Uncharacterized gerABC family protein DDB_G0278001; Flags: Precursor [Dictyostelium discoideum]EAL68173.1 hypothetical protein DDB_G0278001 [Dictyostelium discoideum AX4]|eukprot:XP_642064.1 hypothetical protein DDB_G0278001 [Dictyostelium discoideum AX4]